MNLKIDLKNILKNKLMGAIFLLPLVFLFSCNNEVSKPLSELEAKGKASYMANCTACHNTDPTLQGSIGPEIADSSLELITARVIKKSYPAGYKAKRQSHLMGAMPFLQNDILALHAYLNSFTKH